MKAPFRYVGGGYWRDMTTPVGERAVIVHGEEALDLGRWALVAECLEAGLPYGVALEHIRNLMAAQEQATALLKAVEPGGLMSPGVLKAVRAAIELLDEPPP